MNDQPSAITITQISELIDSRKKHDDFRFLPEFFNLSEEHDQRDFEKLLTENPSIKIHDTIDQQVRELIEIGDPGEDLSDSEIDNYVDEKFGKNPRSQCGKWVYYPWSQKVVHLLDREEFIALRTNRNVYKITAQEQDSLSHRKVAVIGLSVGRSVALTLSMERVVGEIRLVDFDLLELSNLNRIHTTVDQLGLPKVISTAREIAEIDPWIKVRIFPQGATPENLDNIFLEGGQIDLLIDECDGLGIKILARQRAKELRIPVLMDTSDRGMLDVERFDLEPERPILHGYMEHLDVSVVSKLKTSEEKLPYVLPMIGAHNLSERGKASMLEIGESIRTWPQLASSVALGGALCADVCRRIFLNQSNVSGRFYVDLEDIVSSDEERKSRQMEPSVFNRPDSKRFQSLNRADMESMAAQCNFEGENYHVLSNDEANSLIKAAVLAPSGGNVQPWKWLVSKGRLFLFHDAERSYALLDFDHKGSMLAMGAAWENLRLEGEHMGFDTKVLPFPLGADSPLIMAFSFSKHEEKERKDSFEHLRGGITARCTNRKVVVPSAVEPAIISRLSASARSVSGCDIVWITERDRIKALAEVVAAVDRALLLDPRGHHDFVHEVRWNEAEALATRDGIDLETLELTGAEKAGMHIAKNYNVVKKVSQWKGGSAFEIFSRKRMKSASAAGLLLAKEDSPLQRLRNGQCMERLWLSAEHENFGFQPMTAGVFLFDRMNNGVGEAAMSAELKRALEPTYNRFRSCFPEITDNDYPVFLFRLVKASPPKVRALRRSSDEVVVVSAR
jgi:molybdopterin/thiamine biosynthesis adenylyltransferase